MADIPLDPNPPRDRRLFAKIDFDGPIHDGVRCWVWTGTRHKAGYGLIWLDGKLRRAHRVMYTWFVGPIAPKLEIDHLCWNHACCNPVHLEPVTHRVNALRGRHPHVVAHRTGWCETGLHRLEGDNLVARPDGKRACRACKNSYARRRPDRVTRNRLIRLSDDDEAKLLILSIGSNRSALIRRLIQEEWIRQQRA